ENIRAQLVTADPGSFLDFQNTPYRHLTASAPVHDDAGVRNAKGPSRLAGTAKGLNDGINEVALLAHTSSCITHREVISRRDTLLFLRPALWHESRHD